MRIRETAAEQLREPELRMGRKLNPKRYGRSRVTLDVIPLVVEKMNAETDIFRPARFIFSCCFVLGAFRGLLWISQAVGAPPIVAQLTLGAYLISGSIIMAIIIVRSHQPEFWRIQFDLLNVILIATLVALPIGFAMIQWGLHRQEIAADQLPNQSTVLLTATVVGAFFLMPTLFITEALLTWRLWFRKHRE